MIAVVLGTRPEIIKMAPVVREVERRFGPGTALVVHTGQHYDDALAGRFWSELGVRPPQVVLDAGAMTRAGCIGYLTTELGQVFEDHRPNVALVHGDTNTTVAAALAANATETVLVHVEAGLRSDDRQMPEEHNRVVVDHLADLCCAATEGNAANLAGENIPASRIVLTGNTIVEAVTTQLPREVHRHQSLASFGLQPDGYVLATIHRPENTDDPEALRSVLEALSAVATGAIGGEPRPVLFPMHPRTRLAAKRAECEHLLAELQVVDPVGARAFLSLVAHAAVVVSDSGGVAEEVTVLKRPLVIVRRSCERPESIAAGFARVVGPAALPDALRTVLRENRELLRTLAAVESPYGDGRAAARIVDAVHSLIAVGSAGQEA